MHYLTFVRIKPYLAFLHPSLQNIYIFLHPVKLVNWCSDKNLSQNVNKKKEIVIDFRKRRGENAMVHINGDEVESVESFRFLSVQITNKLFWAPHADT